MASIFRVCITCGIYALSLACANVLAPEGGAKDTTPPRLVKSVPAQGSCHFQSRTVKLFFDKEVIVDQAGGKLTTSPALVVDAASADRLGYTCTSQGKTVQITLAQPLEADTTYTFHFDGLIKDVTEGNAAENIQLTFCTGTELDRMSVTGRVYHLMTGQPAANALVGLRRNPTEIKSLWERDADYFVRADKQGNFSLNHVKSGQYTLYATNSPSGRSQIDPGTDAYCVQQRIDLREQCLEDVALYLVKADVRPLQIQRQGTFGPYFEVKFNKSLAHYTLAVPSLQEGQPPVATLLTDGQTVRIYNTFGLLEEDSLPVVLTVTDCQKQSYSEEISLRFEEVDLVEKFTCKATPASGTALPADFAVKIAVNSPIRSLRLDKMYFALENGTIVPIKVSDVFVDEEKNEVSVKKLLSAHVVPTSKTGITLHLDRGAISSIEQTSNEDLSYTYILESPEAFGTISGHVMIDAPFFIVQLLNTDFEVLREIRDERFYRFECITPGVYRVRVLALQRGASTWNPGDVLKEQAPDPVWLYPSPVSVAANWDIENIDFDAVS